MRSPVEDDLAQREAQRHSKGGALIAAYWFSLVSQEPAVVIRCTPPINDARWDDYMYRCTGWDKHYGGEASLQEGERFIATVSATPDPA